MRNNMQENEIKKYLNEIHLANSKSQNDIFGSFGSLSTICLWIIFWQGSYSLIAIGLIITASLLTIGFLLHLYSYFSAEDAIDSFNSDINKSLKKNNITKSLNKAVFILYLCALVAMFFTAIVYMIIKF